MFCVSDLGSKKVCLTVCGPQMCKDLWGLMRAEQKLKDRNTQAHGNAKHFCLEILGGQKVAQKITPAKISVPGTVQLFEAQYIHWKIFRSCKLKNAKNHLEKKRLKADMVTALQNTAEGQKLKGDPSSVLFGHWEDAKDKSA